MSDFMRIALMGKPNSGKSSLFNQLTGLNQKVGNFPGVTVDKHIGYFKLPNDKKAELIDLPGVFSLYPRTPDELVVTEILSNPQNPSFPDKVVLVADATNLKNCLLLLTQLIDLRFPVVLALNMVDMAAQSGQSIDVVKMAESLDVPVVLINARQGHGMEELKIALQEETKISSHSIFQSDDELKKIILRIQERFEVSCEYQAYQLLQQHKNLHHLSPDERQFLNELVTACQFFPGKYQGAETVRRFEIIQDLLNKVVMRAPDPQWKSWSYRIDHILTHKIWGYSILLGLLFFIFQAVFAWAQIPMDFIDNAFSLLSGWLSDELPAGSLTDLLTQGIIPGIGGIVIFVPQIAILFAFISILEETGYMARIVFLMDKIMRLVGLNGKSVVPLMSGWACAIPAIMATRTIDNWKDRLITIFVIPLMSCSARLPVFTILIALIIPEKRIFGFINYQGLAMMALYMFGVAAVFITAYVMSKIIKTAMPSYLLMELPTYRKPRWANVGLMIVEKVRAFVFEAGKIILAISVLLWALASYGPGDELKNAPLTVKQSISTPVSEQEFDSRVAAYKLEHSYAGRLGKWIEPAIAPLGYDWKIGIALITSFAAREAFVGTISTIYSLGDTDNHTVKERLRAEKDPVTLQPRFTLAAGLSLLVFYTLAMQCMSTLAIVKRETKGWKWPIIQLTYLSILAYVCSWITYLVFS